MSWMALLMISAVTLSLTWRGWAWKYGGLRTISSKYCPALSRRARRSGSGSLCGAGMVAECAGLEVGDELGRLVDDRDGPDDQPHGSECRPVAFADDVDAALHAGERRDEDVGARDGGEVF
jgi:hypothetical protein